MSEGFNITGTASTCLDKLTYGVCTKGDDCNVCNSVNEKLDNLKLNEVQLNPGAKDYIPKSRRTDITQTEASTNQTGNNVNENKLNLNLEAKEYIPRNMYSAENNVDEVADAELDAEEFDMIVKDIIDNEVMEEEIEEDEESDEDKWFPKYKDCECCKGFVYKCDGIACANMDMCYCKMKEECDQEDYN